MTALAVAIGQAEGTSDVNASIIAIWETVGTCRGTSWVRCDEREDHEGTVVSTSYLGAIEVTPLDYVQAGTVAVTGYLGKVVET
jgi:hypothetical protein